MKKIPMRTCVVTKEKLPKKELTRVVRTPDGDIIVDDSGKANGRGVYLKLSADVIDQAEKNKVLDRHLEVTVPNDIYNELRNRIK